MTAPAPGSQITWDYPNISQRPSMKALSILHTISAPNFADAMAEK
jgi:hypothetical protein